MIAGSERYIVICKNERQAKLLFEQLVSYWKCGCHSSRGLRGGFYVNHENKLIRGPLTSVTVISERCLFDFTGDKAPVKCRLVNGSRASRWLDRHFEIEKEKKDDQIDS